MARYITFISIVVPCGCRHYRCLWKRAMEWCNGTLGLCGNDDDDCWEVH